MESEKSITAFLITEYGFAQIRGKEDEEKIDVDKFTCILRLHEIHYLFYSEVYKSFSIGVRHEHPKGEAGTKGKKYWTNVMIPKVIKSTQDAKEFVDWIVK